MVRDLVADTIAEGVGIDGVRHRARDRGGGRRARIRRGCDGPRRRRQLRLDKSNVSRRLRMAADGGYIRNLEDKRGKPGRWVIGDPLPESVDLLPEPAQLATADTPPDLSGCAVALGSDGENGDPSSNGFIPPTGPGRCIACGWHIETQGHEPHCQQTGPTP